MNEPFTETTLLEFIQYNNWANRQVLQTCRELGEEQLATPIPGAYGTVRQTLDHIVRAEAWYVELLTGNRPLPAFKWEDGPGFPELIEYSEQVAGALELAAQSVDPAKVVREEDEGQEYYYQALAVYIQIINHGIEHRTNITTVLNQGFHKPPDVDGWGYLSANPERFGAK